jgi:hypothetical protein
MFQSVMGIVLPQPSLCMLYERPSIIGRGPTPPHFQDFYHNVVIVNTAMLG